MKQVNIHQAKTELSKLVERAAQFAQLLVAIREQQGGACHRQLLLTGSEQRGRFRVGFPRPFELSALLQTARDTLAR